MHQNCVYLSLCIQLNGHIWMPTISFGDWNFLVAQFSCPSIELMTDFFCLCPKQFGHYLKFLGNDQSLVANILLPLVTKPSRQTGWTKNCWPNFLNIVWNLPKISSHLMDCSLVSTIDLIIEKFQFLPKKNGHCLNFFSHHPNLCKSP